MDILSAVFIFLLGLIIGSFLNVVIDRLPAGISIMHGRSKCDFCKRTLSPVDLVPVLSFIFLQGRCRYCRKKLSFQYPAIEMITGFLFLFALYVTAPLDKTDSLLSFFYLSFLMGSLLSIFMIDLKYRIIPDEILFVLLIATFIYHMIGKTVIFSFIPFLLSGLGFFLFFLLLSLITRGKGMGFGDVKFAFVMGFILGFPRIITAFYLSFLLGSVISLVLLAIGRKRMKDAVPFGPFLALSTLVSYVYGVELIDLFFRFSQLLY